MTTKQSLLDKTFKDKEGNVVLGQFPNLPIILWFVCIVLDKLIANQTASRLLSLASTVALLAWAYLEIFYGVNYFRRAIGVLVLAYIIVSHLK